MTNTRRACLRAGQGEAHMPWGRLLLGLAVTGLLIFAVVAVVRQITHGVEGLSTMQAPGLGDADRAALALPFEEVLAGRDAELLARLVAGLNAEQAQAQIDHIQSLVPQSSPPATRLLNWRMGMGTNGQWLIGLAEHTFDEHVGQSETQLSRANAQEPWRVAAFNINFVPKTEIPSAGVSFAGRPANYMAVVAAVMVIPALMLATFWAALFWKGLKPRWVWLLMVSLGFCTISLNTVTGAVSFAPISVLLFGASVTWTGSAFDPWVFSFALPLGALAFWLTRAPATADVAEPA